jgi:hypothetical protein
MRYPEVVGKVWSSVSLLLQLHFSNGIGVDHIQYSLLPVILSVVEGFMSNLATHW